MVPPLGPVDPSPVREVVPETDQDADGEPVVGQAVADGDRDRNLEGGQDRSQEDHQNQTHCYSDQDGSNEQSQIPSHTSLSSCQLPNRPVEHEDYEAGRDTDLPLLARLAALALAFVLSLIDEAQALGLRTPDFSVIKTVDLRL